MSTLHDLREALTREAGFDDVELHARPGAVRVRVRTARRQRTGAVVAAAAAALVLTVGATELVHSGTSTPQPARTSLDQVALPHEVSVYGFPYELSGTQKAGADGTVALPDATSPRAVTLVATGLGSGEATLWSGYYPIARVRGGEQISAVTDAASADLRVELDGAPATARAEVAVYEPTGELAPGMSSDGVVFRQSYGDRALVTAAFGRGGEEASAGLDGLSGDIDVSAYCASTTPDLWIHTVGTDGGSPCSDLDQGDDPGAANQSSLLGPQPGDRTYGVYVTVGKDGPRADGADVRFGFGIYRQVVAPTEVFGSDAATVLEANGRTWRLDEVLEPHGDEPYDVDTESGDVLVGVAYNAVRGLSISWRGAPEGGWAGIPQGSEPQSPGVMYPGVLLAGDREVQVDASGPDAQTRLLVYRPE